MRFTSIPVLTSIFATISVVNAHFNITYPTVRGPFNEDNEPNFCDSYTNAGARTPFPLTDGYIAFITSHPSWTAGVLISTKADPTSFNDFHNATGGDQLAVPYFQATGVSTCIKVEIGSLGLQGAGDGANVTLQVVFNGGDGVLYQCSDVTLSSSFKVPSSVVSACSNQTSNTATSSGSGSPTSSGSGSSSSANGGNSSDAAAFRVSGLVAVLVAGAIAALF